MQKKEWSRLAESRKVSPDALIHAEIKCGLDCGLERRTGEISGGLKGFGARERKYFKNGWIKEYVP